MAKEKLKVKLVPYDIYGIYNNVNGKIYIGQTKQGYLVRFKQHLTRKEGCFLIERAIRKYGKESFTCELLDVAYDKKTADEKEKSWIRTLKTYTPERGYNLAMGGAIGDFNLETRKKMSESKKGKNNSFYGKKHTKQSKEKMSECKKRQYQRGNHPRAKKVRCIESGVVYECARDASEKTGANLSHIRSVANGRYGRKTSGGYHWEWV